MDAAQQARNWTDRQESSKLISLSSVLAKIVRSEDEKWQQCSSRAPTELSVEEEVGARALRDRQMHLAGRERVLVTTVVNNCLVEHGRMTKQIHDYFALLERNRVLLNMGVPRTFNNMRVVKSDNDVGDGSDARATDGVKKATVLTGEDLTLYRSCLMCVKFPALCTPELPSPSATPKSDMHTGQYHNQELLSSFSISPAPCPPFGIPSPFDDVSQELPQTFSSSPNLAISPLPESNDMVTVDGLKMYVQDLFQQTDQQHYSHERDLREINGRRNPPELLAKELVTQLSALDSNSQPYYQIQSFVSKNAYDQWVQWEKQKIRHLISLFWRYSLPRPVLKGRRPNYHALYRRLLSKIVSFETRVQRRHHIVLKDSAPSRPLSVKATRLLREFGLRFGVGEMYRRLVYLDYLARHFENDIWYIHHTTAILSSVQDLLPTEQDKMVITRDEISMVETAIQHLHREAEHSLTRIKRLFPKNEPPEGLASLINLLQTTLRGYKYINSSISPPSSLGECLQQYVMDGFVKSYERHKTIAQGELGMLSIVQPVTPELIGSIMIFIQDEVNSYSQYFQCAFHEYFDVTELATTEFYRMLCEDVVVLCQRYVPPEDKLDLQMLNVAYKLTELDREWSCWISPERQVWREHFVKQANVWLDAIGNQMLDWVVKSVAWDNWAILELSPDLLRPKSNCQPKSPTHSVEIGSPRLASILQPSRTSAFRRVSRVTGENSENSSLNCGPSSVDSSVAGQQSSSSVSLVESIQSRLSSISKSRQPGPNNDKLIASLEQASELHVADSFSIGIMNMETKQGSNSPSEKPSRLLTFGSSHENKMQVQQTPSFMRHMQSLVGSIAHDRKEVCNDASKQKKQKSRRCADSEEGLQPVHFMRERDGLQNATPVAINIQRPSVLRTMASSTFFSHSPSPVKQLQPNAVTGSESLGKVRPVAMPTKECLQRNSDYQLSRSGTIRPASCDWTHPRLQSASIAINHEREQSPKLHIPANQGMGGKGQFRPVSDSVDSCQLTEPTGTAVSPKQLQLELTDSLSGITEGTFCAIDQAKPNKPPLLPVSSSVIDIMTALIRLARFTETINHVLKPLQGRQASGLSDNTSHFGQNSAESVASVEGFDDKLRDKLTEAILCTLIVYVNNMLCTDLCGVSEQEAYNLIGNELLSQVQECQQKQLIWGCRHMAPHGIPYNYYVVPDCLLYGEKGAQRQSFERVSFDMCVRVNNVAALHCILPALHGHLMQVADVGLTSNPAKELTSSYDSGSQYGSPTYPAAALSYGPAKHDHYKSSASGHSSTVSSLVSDSPFLHNIVGRIADVQKCQIRLLCYRMNSFIKPSLKVLLSLVLPEKQYTLQRRLDPVLHYLARHLSALADGLYPQSFLALLQCMWDFLISDFKEMIDELINAQERSCDLAHLYLHSIALLVEFFHAGGAGADMDMLIFNAGFVLELLELHTLSTQKLIVVYNQLLKIEKAYPSPESDRTSSFMGELRKSLHQFLTCFSGQDFTDTVVSLQLKASPPSPCAVETPCSLRTTEVGSEYEYAVRLGQQLLDTEVIQHVPSPGDEEHQQEATAAGNQFTGSTQHLYRFVTGQDCTEEDRDVSHSSSYSSLSNSKKTSQEPENRGEYSHTCSTFEKQVAARATSACVVKILKARCSYDQSAKHFLVKLSKIQSPTDK